MLIIKKIESLSEITSLKQQYFALATAPLDGMWHFGFVPMAAHFGFVEDDKLVGFCCVNAEGYMLQFYLSPFSISPATELFGLISQQLSREIGAVKGAFVSTAEADYLSLCLDNSSTFKVNSLMYHQRDTSARQVNRSPLDMSLATSEQLEAFVAFAAANIGAPEQWLTGYYGNLINRKELWGYWVSKQLIASGECRLFDDYQIEYADLGMIVVGSERGKGIATQVLKSLIHKATARGLSPICSTEQGNIGAQKAMQRAGLTSSQRIIQFEFMAM